MKHSDNLSKEEAIRLGDSAERLVTSEAFEVAYEQLLNNLFLQFIATESHQGEERDKLWDLCSAMTLLKSMLEKFSADAKIEKENLKNG